MLILVKLSSAAIPCAQVKVGVSVLPPSTVSPDASAIQETPAASFSCLAMVVSATFLAATVSSLATGCSKRRLRRPHVPNADNGQAHDLGAGLRVISRHEISQELSWSVVT